MSLFNEKLKNIPLIGLLITIILLFSIQYFFNRLNIVQIDSIWIYILIIFYIIFKLNGNFPDKNDFMEVISKDNLSYILFIVILNIFLSYGFLYLSYALLDAFPALNFLSATYLTSNSIMGLGLIATIFVSPIAEELIFRGVFLNQFKSLVPPLFAVLISSLLFAALHPFGSLTSAFIFAICMAILYIKTDNILVPIFAHFLNNLFAQIIFYVDVDKVLFTNGLVMGIMSVLSVISFILLCRLMIKELNNVK